MIRSTLLAMSTCVFLVPAVRAQEAPGGKDRGAPAKSVSPQVMDWLRTLSAEEAEDEASLKARMNASMSLGMRGAAVAPELAKALDDEAVAVAAAKALIRLDAPAAPYLLGALTRAGDAGRRGLAAEALGQLDEGMDVSVILALTRVLEDPQAEVARAAADSLRGVASRALAAGETQDKLQDVMGGMMRATLRDQAAEERLRAAEHLDALEQLSLPVLCRVLEGGDAGRREGAALALAELGKRSALAVPALLKALGSSEGATRAVACFALGRIGAAEERVVAALAAALSDKEPVARLHAAQALGRLGAPAAGLAVKALAGALADGEEEVLKSVVMALAAMGPAAEPASARLIELARHEQPSVRRAALGALGEIKVASPPTLQALQTGLGEAEEDVAVTACLSLADLGPAAAPALPLLKGLLARGGLRRIAATRVAGAIGPPAASLADMILPGLKDEDTELRAAAAGALGAMRVSSAARQLLTLLRDEEEDVRAAAVKSLAALKAEAPLRELWHDAKAPLAARALAVATLVTFCAPEKLLPELIEGLSAKEPELANAAAGALGVLGPKASPARAALVKAMERGVVMAIGALGLLGADAVPDLVQGYRAAAGPQRATHRLLILEALGGLESAAAPALPLLLEELATSDLLCAMQVVGCLGRIGAPAVPRLAELAGKGPSQQVKQRAIEALGQVGAPAVEALDVLREALTQKALRRDAAEALAAMGPAAAPAVDDLIALLAETEPAERVALLKALRRVAPNDPRVLKALGAR